jgi:hypothetical protein
MSKHKEGERKMWARERRCAVGAKSLGVGGGAAKLEFTLLAVNGHATTSGAMLVETRASDTHD